MGDRTCTCTPLLSSTAPSWPTTIHQHGCPAAFGTDALGHGIAGARADEKFSERLRSSIERHKPILDRPKVSGRCPACGTGSLFVAEGDHVTCGYIPCPDPCLVADFLLGVKGPDLHVAEFSEGAWHLEHTMRCRLDGMSDCLIHKALSREPYVGQRGRFHVDIVSGVLHYQEAPDGH